MTRNPIHDIAIVAVHNTQQARKLDIDETELLTGAMRAVMAETGLKPKDIDGVCMNGWTQGLTALHAIDWLGGHPCWFDNHYPGITWIMAAAGAIATGQCNTVLLAAGQSGAYQVRSNTAPWTRPDYEFTACWGMMTPAQFALVARRHMKLYGTKVEAFAEIASAIRTNGSKHPQAVYYGKPVTPEDVLNSRMIADPFHLLDCATTTEGGAAIIMTTRERAKDMDVTPIYILGGAIEATGFGYTIPPVWDQCVMMGAHAAEISFRQAGLTPEDIDFCEFYDPFSYEIIRQLEAFGFCKFGEGSDFVLDGNIRIDGKLPIVTNGGTMSFSHPGIAQMIQKVIAGVQQLRGDVPPELRVKDAKIGLISNSGSAALQVDVMLLGTEAAA
jgi:acetyl-CoA acetyltransferase